MKLSHTVLPMIMSSTRVFQSWPAPRGFLRYSMNPNINTLPCCLLLICEQDSSAVQYKQICKTQLPSQAAFWAPALAGVLTVLQRPRTQPSLDLPVFLLIPLTKNLLLLSCAVLGVGVNMSGHVALAWPFLLMSVGQTRMRISLSFSPRFVSS